MSLIDRRFRLADTAGSLGLHCNADGVWLAGAPLLRKSVNGWEPRPDNEINALLRAAYGRDLDPAKLTPGLRAAASALDDGDLGRAMIATLRMRLPEPGPTALARVAHAEATLEKYNVDEPRDRRGRWTTDGGEAAPPSPPNPAPMAPTVTPPRSTLTPKRPKGGTSVQTQPSGQSSQPTPPQAASTKGDIYDVLTLHRTLESNFDPLGPVEFAKRVQRFSDWLGQESDKLGPLERLKASVEYAFLQDRVQFWLNYPYTPTRARENVLGAGLMLFTAGQRIGLDRPGSQSGRLPAILAEAGTTAMAFDGGAPGRGRGRGLTSEELESYRPTSTERPERVGEIGGVIHNDDAKIVWNGGIKDQGEPFEDIYSRLHPWVTRLNPVSKTFDFYFEDGGRAVSLKTLNILSYTYIKNPKNIYARISRYIDSAANYHIPRTRYDVNPNRIRYRQLSIGIPESTSPSQWKYIMKADSYAKSRNVLFEITRIRER